MKKATKKWSALGLVACLSISLAACQQGGQDQSPSSGSKEKKIVTVKKEQGKFFEVKVMERYQTPSPKKDEVYYMVQDEVGRWMTITFSKKTLGAKFPSKDLVGMSLKVEIPLTEDLVGPGVSVVSFKPLKKSVHEGVYSRYTHLTTALEMYQAENEFHNALGLLDTDPSDKVLTARVLELKDADGMLQKYALVNLKELMKTGVIRKFPSFLKEYDVLSESKKDVALAVQVDKSTKVGNKVELSKDAQGQGYAFVQKGKVEFKVE